MADPAPNNACRNPQDNRGGGGVMPNASSQHAGLWGWFEGSYSRAVCTAETAYNEVAGAVTHGYNATTQAVQAGYTVASDELRSWVDSIPEHIAHATNWPELKYWAELALGYESFQVGVGVGLAEGLVGAVVDIAKLAWSLVKLQMKIWELQKTFIFAALYEQAHADQLAAIAQNPFTYPVAKAANWLMGKELEAADKKVHAMLDQLERLLTHPSPDFKKLFNELLSAMGRGKDSLIGGWKHYKTLLTDSKPSAKFEAGVMTGKVLFEVIMLILLIISIYGAAAEAGTAIARVAGRFMARFAEEFPALYEFIVGARDVAEAERMAPAVERAAEAERAVSTAERAATTERTTAEGEAAAPEELPKKNPKTRLPRSNGEWKNGAPGNGDWYSNNPKVTNITGGKPVKFTDGRPDFSPWSKGEIEFEPGELDGTDADFDKVYDQIKEEKGLPSRAAAKAYLKDQGLTPHHLDNNTIQLVPSDLHNNVPHVGAASDLRGGYGASSQPDEPDPVTVPDDSSDP